MPKCVVRLRDTLEIQHSVVIYAESLYEAVVRGLNQLAEVGWESHADETVKQVEVEIYQEPTMHIVDVPKLLKWINQNVMSPRQQTLKEKLRSAIIGFGEDESGEENYRTMALISVHRRSIHTTVEAAQDESSSGEGAFGTPGARAAVSSRGCDSIEKVERWRGRFHGHLSG